MSSVVARYALAAPALAAVLIAGCDGTADTTTTSTSTTTTTTSTTTTTTTLTATTVPSTHLLAPDQVTDVVVGTGGGSEEMMIDWSASGSANLASYELYYSDTLGGPYGHLATIRVGDNFYLDFPRPEAAEKPGNCYKLSAVDAGGHEGPKSVAACFQPSFFPVESGGIHGAVQWGGLYGDR